MLGKWCNKFHWKLIRSRWKLYLSVNSLSLPNTTGKDCELFHVDITDRYVHVCYYSMAIEVLSMVWQQQAEWRRTGIHFAETSRQRYKNNNFFWLKRPYLLYETSILFGRNVHEIRDVSAKKHGRNGSQHFCDALCTRRPIARLRTRAQLVSAA